MGTRSLAGRFFEGVLWSATAVTVYGVARLMLTGRARPGPFWVLELMATFPVFGGAVVFSRCHWRGGRLPAANLGVTGERIRARYGIHQP